MKPVDRPLWAESLLDFMQPILTQASSQNLKNAHEASPSSDPADPRQQANQAELSLGRLLAEQLEAGHTLLPLSSDQLALASRDPLCQLIPADNDSALTLKCPILIDAGTAQFARQWQQEQDLAAVLSGFLKTEPSDVPAQPESNAEENQLLSGLNEGQLAAVQVAMHQRFCVITGGPGTGKTHTLARLVGVLMQSQPGLRIALAAPTGKAAQRMQESLGDSLAGYRVPPARTIHSLIGLRPDGAPRFHAERPLPFDLVVIDEASMLGLELALQLLSACTQARVVLLGDANQLAAVEAGAVLHDLCQASAIAAVRVNLTQSRRFDEHSVIGQLARHSLAGEAAHILGLNHPNFTQLTLSRPEQLYADLQQCYQSFHDTAQALKGVDSDSVDMSPVFAAFSEQRVLGATRGGEFGNNQINDQLVRRFGQGHRWFTGLPVMIAQNERDLGLSNGDIGICQVDHHGQVRVFFEHRSPLLLSSLSLDHLEVAYALTVHKSQGSEFDQVILVLAASSDQAASILSRELVYTAITRAKTSLTLYDQPGLLERSLASFETRHTGLGIKLERLVGSLRSD